jgi:hypothetical protein
MSGAPSGFNGQVIKGVGGSGSIIKRAERGRVHATTGGMTPAAWSASRRELSVNKSTLNNVVTKVIRKG